MNTEDQVTLIPWLSLCVCGRMHMCELYNPLRSRLEFPLSTSFFKLILAKWKTDMQIFFLVWLIRATKKK